MPPVVKPKTQYDNSHWKRGETRYAPADGRKAITAPALLYGPWAVVRDEKNGKYDLVHLRSDSPTALDIATESDACRIGDWLWRMFPLILRLTTVEEMRERMDPALRTKVNQWIKSCERAGKYLLPPNV